MTFDSTIHRHGIPEGRGRFQTRPWDCSIPPYKDAPDATGANSSSGPSWKRIAGQEYSRHQDHFDRCYGSNSKASTDSTSTTQFSVNHGGGQRGDQESPSSLSPSDSFSFEFPSPQNTRPNDGFMSYSSPDSAAWQPGDVFTPTSSHMGSQSDENPFPDGQPGSYGGLYSFPSTSLLSDGQMGSYGSLLSFAKSNPLSDGQPGSYENLNDFSSSSPDTFASAFSEPLGVLETSPSWGSPLGNERLLKDLRMPEGYHELASHSPDRFDRENSKDSPSERSYVMKPPGWGASSGYTSDDNTSLMMFDPINVQFSGAQDPAEMFNQTHAPWNPEHPQHGEGGVNAGTSAFLPEPGYPHKIFKRRETLFRSSNPAQPYFKSQDSFPIRSNKNDEEQLLSRHTFVPHAYDIESSQDSIQMHEHVLSFTPDLGPPDKYLGQKRKLTTAQRERTLEVRREGACWACHLLKTQCSPCSSGSPCEQCTRLVGKRRFCLLSCFNDPIESLQTFLAPDCLVGHLNRTSVEAFLSKHAIHGGDNHIPAQMSWGCRKLIRVNLVTFSLLDDSSELAYNHQAITNEDGSVELVRNRCAPLGINLADIDEMRNAYRLHVEDVVENDLLHYVSIAYDDQSSKFAESLLEAVCVWYQKGFGDDDERVLLRQAIEIHVANTILERSLILDKASIEDVREHFRQDFPILSAPRGAQRQIKLAVFLEQRPRMVWVLKQWGKLMRNPIRAEKNWQTAFCVLVVLMLTMDKTIAAAHNFCEGRIKFRGRDAKCERETFENLRRSMETSLFERCKEIFHCRYKTRKGGNERCNPIKDGTAAWRGREVDQRTAGLIADMQKVVRDFVPCKAQAERGSVHAGQVVYSELGRLCRIFLSDF